MSEGVTDLRAVRIAKESAKLEPGRETKATTIVCCGGCECPTFCLAEGGIVFCSKCHEQIGPLGWFDKRVAPTPA